MNTNVLRSDADGQCRAYYHHEALPMHADEVLVRHSQREV